jgi:effector-binding domain-containing protein
MPTLPILTILGIVVGVAPAQEPLPDARALLERREQVLGPLEARTRARGLAIRGSLALPGGFAARFEELHRVGPGEERVLFTLTMEAFGTSTQGTDGTLSWTTDPGFGIAIAEGPEQMPVRRMWAIQRSAPWSTLYAAARTLGVVERDGRALFEIEMTPLEPEGKPERWYLDRETGELARVAVVYPGPTGERLPMEFVLADWRAVDGILYPHKRVQEVLGALAPQASGSTEPGSEPGAAAKSSVMAIVYLCESIRHEALEPARLAPPPNVAEAIRDPAKRAQKPPIDPSACTLETIPLQLIASVRLEIDASKVSETLAVTLGEVIGAVSAQGVEMTGPPFSRYHRIDTVTNRIDLEAGLPVQSAIRSSGRVKPGELPAGRAAMTWHVGSYHELQKSYDRLGAWLAAEELRPRGGFWEVYWTDPGLEPDPSTWRTQLFWPVE